MHTPYVLSFQDIRDYCESLISNDHLVSGECKKCRLQRVCRLDKKQREIYSALCMQDDETRYPILYPLIQRYPALLYGIPAIVYEKKYGSYQKNLPCPFASREIAQHMDELYTVYSMLEDGVSKYTLLNILMYRLSINREYALRSYCEQPQYFIEPFRNGGNEEVYVDCGAYVGDTLEAYCAYNPAPKIAYLYEPDNSALKKMNATITKYNSRTMINVIKEGVYKKSSLLYFVSSTTSESYLTEHRVKNGVPMPVVSIDETVNEEISFIKMDIEGSELDALLGAEKHILSSYPKLAICVYHNPSDMWTIPLMIKARFPKYRHFMLRHHSMFFAETVLYVY